MRFFYFLAALILTHPLHPSAKPQDLKSVEQQLERDLALIDYDPTPWTRAPKSGEYDVVVVGGGMAGMCATFALMKLGITNVVLFDEHPEGREGCWPNYARMRELRSQKIDMGPALDVPRLTFRAWFEAQYGAKEWELLKRAPTDLWMDYLRWYRKVLKLPVQNNTRVLRVVPHGDLIEVDVETDGVCHSVLARKVVLATGRPGFGGHEIPSFAWQLPRHMWAHTGECLDFSQLASKRVAVVGGGASAFDAAAVALEQGAAHVDMLVRRTEIPTQNKWVEMTTPGMLHGFYFLPDAIHWTVMCGIYEAGTPPPLDSIQRVTVFPNMTLRTATQIRSMSVEPSGISVVTSQGNFQYDFIIFATGFAIDGSKEECLKDIHSAILLWGDRNIACTSAAGAKLKMAPYLGEHFQFLEKESGIMPSLRHIHCFNYAATFSHGMISGDVYGISIGAQRLAQGIAGDLFREDLEECLLSD